MPNLQQLQPHIIYRLALAKTIYRKATEFCDTQNDIYNFSNGLIALHDALDNFTGAIATHLNINLPQDSNLRIAINLIQEAERKSDPNFVLISRNEAIQLNTIRNNIKHHGIMPNINQAKGLIAPISSFFREYCQRYFNLEWELVSLAELIRDNSIKGKIKSVEDQIEQDKYKDALNEMAIIKFQIFEEFLLQMTLDPKYDFFSSPTEETKKLRGSNNIFPEQSNNWLSNLYKRADFLEKGINRDMMQRFEDLTAKVGFNNNKEWKYILKHSHNWSLPNWTKENAIFCYNFLVDAILKRQSIPYGFKEMSILTYYIIKAREEINFYNKEGKPIYTMQKGEKRKALIFGRVDKHWEDYQEFDRYITLLEEDEKSEVHCFYEESDKDKMEFLETKQFTRDDDGNLLIVQEIVGG